MPPTTDEAEAETSEPEVSYRVNRNVVIDGHTYHTGDILTPRTPAEHAFIANARGISFTKVEDDDPEPEAVSDAPAPMETDAEKAAKAQAEQDAADKAAAEEAEAAAAAAPADAEGVVTSGPDTGAVVGGDAGATAAPTTGSGRSGRSGS